MPRRGEDVQTPTEPLEPGKGLLDAHAPADRDALELQALSSALRSFSPSVAVTRPP